MSNKTKQQLITENNANFPNNNSGFITPEKLRTFNGDMIDSTVNQIEYTTDSGSFNTRILESVVTASIAGDILTFERENGNTFDITISGATIPPGTVSGSSQIDYPQISNIPSGIVSGSSQVSYTGLSNIPSGIVSSSSQVILQQTSGNLSGSRIDGLVLSSSYAISSSHSEIADEVPFSGVLNKPTLVSGSSQIILQDTTGLLSGSRIDGAVALATNSTYAQNTITTGKNLHNTTIAKGTPLFFTGSGTSGNLVGVYPADAGNPDRMPAGGIAGESLAVGAEGIVLLDGFISGVDTSLFASGDEVFVAVGGGYTNVAPTGSALIQHLGNVEKSAVNGSGVIQMMGEVRGLPNILQGHTWVGDSNGVPQAVTTQSVVEHIFTQNNTFTGTQTFDNIAVNGTASFAYIESITGSAKIIGDAFIILNNNTPTERYAGVAVQDSGSTGVTASFQFDGGTNDWFYEYSDDGGVTTDHGVALFGPEYNTKGSPIYPTNNRIQKGDGGHHILDSNISDDGSTVSINSNTQITGSLLINGNTPLITSDLTSLNAFTESADGRLNNIELTTASLQSQINGLSGVTGSYATTGSNTFIGIQTITGSLTISGSESNDVTVVGRILITGPNTGQTPQFIVSSSDFNTTYSRIGMVARSTGTIQGNYVANNTFQTNNDDFTILGYTIDPSNILAVNNWSTGPVIYVDDNVNGPIGVIGFQSAPSYTDGTVTILKPLDVSGSLDVLGSTQITGSFSVSGSVNTSVHNLTITSQTASLDGSKGNMFVLNLVSATDTRLEVSNLKSGQTINLLVSQSSAGNGTLTTAPNLLEPSGSEYSASQVANAQDILTLATFFNPNTVYVANIKTMI